MRLETVTNSPIEMRSTEGPDFSIDPTKKLYAHEVGWIAQTGCEPGFLAQKVDRSFKYSVGSVDSRGRWRWAQETVCRARYWEIWEIFDAPAGRGNPRRIRIYPGVHSSLALIATSRGLLTRDELKGDSNKRPRPSLKTSTMLPTIYSKRAGQKPN